ncbi:MAG TPA: phosphoribosyltransferase family protein [Candidatus Bathyarchaeia archaeon]|nr:phosphoribosyltransferase family protein [Candidatus Bathyarchaeia archaeon]
MKNNFLILDFDTIWDQINILSTEIIRSYKPDILIGISRGGLVITRLFSDILGIEDIGIIGIGFYTNIGETTKEPTLIQELTISIEGKKVLLIDDVSDSGRSLEFAVQYLKNKGLAEIKTVTLHYKPHSIFKPDYFITETTKWIVYPWEKIEFARLFYQNKLKSGLTKEQAIEKLRKLAIIENVSEKIIFD